MTYRRATMLVALMVSAGLGMLAGCDSGSEDNPMDDGSDPASAPSTAPSDQAMADALQRSRRAFLDATLGLRSAGYAPTFGFTHYAICTDESADWRGSANGGLHRKAPTRCTPGGPPKPRDGLAWARWA